MKKKLTVNSDQSLSNAIGYMRDLYRDKKYLTVSFDTGKARTLNQNALSHAWYLQVSLEEREYTPEHIKCLCKYHFGLPILRGDDEEFNALCERIIDVLPYEDRISAMKYLPVTSLMKTKQINLYLEHVQGHYVGRCDLTFPDEN